VAGRVRECQRCGAAYPGAAVGLVQGMVVGRRYELCLACDRQLALNFKWCAEDGRDFAAWYRDWIRGSGVKNT
jgi:hypothetical protein